MSTRFAGGLQVKLIQRYRLAQREDVREWHTSTLAYEYKFADADGRELMSWRWHPQTGFDRPHLHICGGPASRKAHLPTGRVSVEAVIRLLLTDFGVPPAPAHAADYTGVLDAAERDFVTHRRWHGWRGDAPTGQTQGAR